MLVLYVVSGSRRTENSWQRDVIALRRFTIRRQGLRLGAYTIPQFLNKSKLIHRLVCLSTSQPGRPETSISGAYALVQMASISPLVPRINKYEYVEPSPDI